MAAIDVQNILQGLQQGVIRRRAAFQQQLDQQQQDQLNQYRQQSLEQEQNQFNAQHDIATKNLALTKALKTFDIQQKLADLSSQGSPIAGSTVTPAADNQTQQVQIPLPQELGGPTTLNTPTPEAIANRQANLARVTQAPAIEAKIAEGAPGLAASMQRTVLERQSEEKIAANAQAAENWRNRQDIAQRANASRLTAGLFTPEELASYGNMPSGEAGEVNPDLTMAQDAHNKLQNGLLTEDDLKSMKPAMKQMFTMQALAQGSHIISKDQVKFLQDLGAAKQTIPLMLDFLDKQPDSVSYAQSLKNKLFNIANPDLTNAENELKSKQATLTRTLGGINRLAVPEINFQENSSMLDQKTPKATNAVRVGQFVQALDMAVDAKLGNLPPGQIAHIKQQYGIDKIQKLVPVLKSKQPNRVAVNDKTGDILVQGTDGTWNPIK